MNNLGCKRPCSPSDMDEFGNCKCDREVALLNKVQLLSLIGKMKRLRDHLRQIQVDYLELHSMKFIPVSDALCSFNAAIKKLSDLTVNQKNENKMDEITCTFSPDEFALITNLVTKCHEDKYLRSTISSLGNNKNPFFLSKLLGKLNEQITTSQLASKIEDDLNF